MVLNDKKDSIDIYLQQAEDKAKPFDKRKEYSNKVLKILLNQPNDSLNRANIFRVSYNFYHLNEWKDLKKVATIGYKRALEENNQSHLALAERHLGLYYESTSQNDSAFYYYFQAEKRYKQLNDINNLCLVYRDKAQIQYYVNDYLGAEITLINAIKIAREANNIYQQFYILKFIGSLSNELHDYETANRFNLKAFQLLDNNPEKFSNIDKVQIFNDIAYNFNKIGQLKKALFFYKKALSIDKLEFDSPNIHTVVLDNYGYALFKSKRLKLVFKIYSKAAQIRDNYNIDNGKNYNRLFLSEYYAAIKDTSKAISFAQEALSLSKSFQNSGDMLVSLKQLAQVDTQNALQHNQQYIRISDSMQLLERQTRNKFAKIAYETEEITQEKEAAVKKNWIISGIASGIILVLVLLLIIKTQRAKQKRLQLEQIQQKANEQIYNLMLDQQNKIDLGRSIEKKRIAKDLHDSIMNRMASTRLNLHILNEKATPQTIRKCLPYIDNIQDIEKEIRQIAHDLNQGLLGNKDNFVTILEDFISDQKTLFSIKIDLEIDPNINWELLSSFKKIHVFRIFQEAFQNIYKHAHAHQIVVTILKQEHTLLLEIFDDGNGFDSNKKKKGIGLQNMKARTQECQGVFTVKSIKDKGTTVIVSIPLTIEVKK